MEILKVNTFHLTTKTQLLCLRFLTTKTQRIHQEHGGVANAKEYFLSLTKNTDDNVKSCFIKRIYFVEDKIIHIKGKKIIERFLYFEVFYYIFSFICVDELYALQFV